ncbi:MAG: hypothetical protein HYZ09_00400 [Candidatus Kerfeldbacteria bacterium]|nr:hypothetical protein [Candidatus Kerfeldbacteria bacterium]
MEQVYEPTEAAIVQPDEPEQPQPSRARRWMIALTILIAVAASLYIIIPRNRTTETAEAPTEPVVEAPAEVRSPTVAGAVVSARDDGTLVLPYRNEDLRFSLEFPLSWEGYRVTQTPVEDRMLVTFEYPQLDDASPEDGRIAFTVYGYTPGTILPTDLRVLTEERGILYGFSVTRAADGRAGERAFIPSVIASFSVFAPPEPPVTSTDAAGA